MANSTKYCMKVSKENGKETAPIALFSSDISIDALRAIGKVTFNTMQLKEIQIVDMDTGKMIYYNWDDNYFDYLMDCCRREESEWLGLDAH